MLTAVYTVIEGKAGEDDFGHTSSLTSSLSQLDLTRAGASEASADVRGWAPGAERRTGAVLEPARGTRARALTRLVHSGAPEVRAPYPRAPHHDYAIKRIQTL